MSHHLAALPSNNTETAPTEPLATYDWRRVGWGAWMTKFGGLNCSKVGGTLPSLGDSFSAFLALKK